MAKFKFTKYLFSISEYKDHRKLQQNFLSVGTQARLSLGHVLRSSQPLTFLIQENRAWLAVIITV